MKENDDWKKTLTQGLDTKLAELQRTCLQSQQEELEKFRLEINKKYGRAGGRVLLEMAGVKETVERNEVCRY